MNNWRCSIGLHYPRLFDDWYRNMEPPDPWWHCVECGFDVLPFRGRIHEWWFGTRIGARHLDWLIARDTQEEK